MMRFRKLPGYTILATAMYLLLMTGCRKDALITAPSARLGTSTDSLRFDTVFTSTGSVTQSMTVRNENDQPLLLSSVRLMGGALSPYRLNINGIEAPVATDLRIAANDSIYLFVSVTIDPSLDNLPFLVKDSIEIVYNGNTRYVQLEAFGQNAHFLRNRVITGDITWDNRLPYVILGQLQIDTTASLTLEAGCRVYCHAAAPILVDGTLRCNGTVSAPVIFRGARTDEDYKDLPASWPGIYFRTTSLNNELTCTHVRNAYQAVVAENPASGSQPKVKLQQCIIDNAYDAGILAVSSSLEADNTLVSNCGSNISLVLGGDYRFTHCTVAAYPGFFQHKNPVLSAGNAVLINGSPVSAPLQAAFTNCIFWGEGGLVDNEVQVSRQGTDPFDVRFVNCLIKNNTDPPAAVFTDCLRNSHPLFDSVNVARRYFDFHTSNPAAPGLDKGVATALPADLDGNPRSNGLPDLGCYEKQ